MVRIVAQIRLENWRKRQKRCLKNFSKFLLDHNYSESTVKQYSKSLKNAEVDLTNFLDITNHIAFGEDDEDDPNGCRYRALLAYQRFFVERKVPGGRDHRNATMSLEDACLKHTSRVTMRRMIWLHLERQNKVSTASFYAKIFDKGPDRHCNVKRSKAALQRLPTEAYAKAMDNVLSFIYRNNKVKNHYESLD